MGKYALIIAQLQSFQKNSSQTDGFIADFLLNNLNEISMLSINEIVEKTNTSYATVCRFFKKMNLSGLKEFKSVIISKASYREQTRLENDDYRFQFSNITSQEQIINRICDFSANVISNIENTIDMDDVARALLLLKNAKSIHFIGFGTSAITAQYGYTKFFRILNNCSFDTDIIISRMKVSIMGPHDVLFAISSSGRTNSVLDISNIAMENGVPIISLSDFSISPLASASDVAFSTTIREANKYIDADFPLIQGQVTIIDILYSSLYQHIQDTAQKKIEKTFDAVTSEKQIRT